MKTIIYLILTSFIFLSCASKQVVVESPGPESTPPEIYTLVCVDENDAPLSCETDDDCCEGFSCVKDSTGGRYSRTCEYDKGN